MPQVVEHAHEDDKVESLPTNQAVDVVHVALNEVDLQAELGTCEACLTQIGIVVVDPEHSARAAALHLERVEAAIAADVEDALAGQIIRKRVFEELPEVGGKVPQWVVRRSLDLAVLAQPQIVKPRTELRDLCFQRLHVLASELSA